MPGRGCGGLHGWRKPEADAHGRCRFPEAGHESEDIRSTPTDDAVGFIDALLAVPGVEMPHLGAEWPMFRELCVEQKLAANDIPDAWLAAAVSRLGEHLVTFDVDFRKLLKRTQLTVLSPN